MKLLIYDLPAFAALWRGRRFTIGPVIQERGLPSPQVCLADKAVRAPNSCSNPK